MVHSFSLWIPAYTVEPFAIWGTELECLAGISLSALQALQTQKTQPSKLDAPGLSISSLLFSPSGWKNAALSEGYVSVLSWASRNLSIFYVSLAVDSQGSLP